MYLQNLSHVFILLKALSTYARYDTQKLCELVLDTFRTKCPILQEKKMASGYFKQINNWQT